MRGLGFKIIRKDDQTYVGHDGGCPGYHSVLLLRPATETAVVLMATGDRQPPAPAKDVDLEAYAGRYSAQPWHSEVAIVPWGMGPAALWLPSTDPAEDIEVLKPKGGDLFRRLRADGSEADEVRFERDNAGRVYRFVEFSNAHDRLAEVSSGEPNKQ